MTFLHEWEAKAITKWTALSKSSNVRKKGSDLEEKQSSRISDAAIHLKLDCAKDREGSA